MNMRRTEDHHHNSGQITGYLRDARAVCDDAGLSAAERVAVLPQLVALFASKQVFYEQPTMLPSPILPQLAGRR